MGKTSQKDKRLAGRVSLALAAGMFSVVPTVHGMPTADTVTNAADARSAGLGISTSGNTMNVTGTQQNTVAHWKDFSIADKETVQFENDKNFMNIVTGNATSAIDGIMKGGNNVYLINPNGVIFGATAKVNVGNLYVSTRNDFENLRKKFTGKNAAGADVEGGAADGSAVLTTLSGNDLKAVKADVVSLIDDKGYVAATEVVLEGNNIRFLNANALAAGGSEPVAINGSFTSQSTGTFLDDTISHPTDPSKIVFRAKALGTVKNTDNYGDGYIHVGNGRNDGKGKQYAGAINYSAETIGQSGKRTSTGVNGEDNGVVNYSLIRTATGSGASDDLSYINSNLTGNFMLANEIVVSGMNKTIGRAQLDPNDDVTQPNPLYGTNEAFRGYFDGMFYTVKKLNLTKEKTGAALNQAASYAGLFAYAKDAHIENVGVENANVKTYHAGSIVGYADNTMLRNVWNAGGNGQIGVSGSVMTVGGIVGAAINGTQLTNAYNMGKVYGAGLIGYLNNSGIRNAYNAGYAVPVKGDGNTDNTSKIYGIYNFCEDYSKIVNTFTATQYLNTTVKGTELVGTEPGTGDTSTVTNSRPIKSASDITAWLDNAKKTSGTNAGKSSISSEGGSGKTWRYYENLPTGTDKKLSLPMLTAFFKGVVSTDYQYDTHTTTGGVESSFNSLSTYAVVNPDKNIMAASKTYDGIEVSPYNFGKNAGGDYVFVSYQEADGGAYVIDANGTFILDPKDGTYAGATHYAEIDGYMLKTAVAKDGKSYINTSAGAVKYDDNIVENNIVLYSKQNFTNYLGANAASNTKINDSNSDYYIGTYRHDQQNVLGGADQKAFALYASGQQGYDLYGNNFQITKRNISATVDISGNANKVYDGSPSNTYFAKDLLTTTGIFNKIEGDDVSVGGTVTYNYGTKDFGIKTLTVETNNINPTGSDAGNYNLSITVGNKPNTAEISKRKVVVTLDHYGDIDKTYDGTTDLRAADQASANVKYSASEDQKNLPVTLADLLGKNKQDKVYLDYNTGVAYDNKNAGNKTVKYTGIALKDNDNTNDLGNYDLIVLDKNGQKVTATNNEYTLTGTGTISKRKITSFGTGVANAPFKTYDGLTTMGDGVTFEISNGDLTQVTTAQATDATDPITTGLLEADAAKVFFMADGNVEFQDKDGNATANASNYNGENTGAQKAVFNVILNTGHEGYDAVTANNYEISGGAVRTGTVISKRTVKVQMGTPTGIDKTYDKTNDVSSTYTTFGGDYAQYADTTSRLVASDVANEKAAISVSAKYQAKGIDYDDNNAAYVAYENADSDTVIAKSILYTVTITGENAGNYVLKKADDTGTAQTVTLNATGKITPLDLQGLAFSGSAIKSYDGDAKAYAFVDAATGLNPLPSAYPTMSATNLAGDQTIGYDSINELFDPTKVTGTYVQKTGSTATPPNIGEYNVEYTMDDLNAARTIKGKNYKVTNTVYGVGEIKARSIKKQTLAEKVTAIDNTLNTKVYDGDRVYYDATGTSTIKKDSAFVANADTYLQFSNDAKASMGIAQADYDKMQFSIAKVLYDNETTGKNVGDDKAMTMTFTFTDASGNYELYDGDTKLTGHSFNFDKSGYQGNITPRAVHVSVSQGAEKTYDGTNTVEGEFQLAINTLDVLEAERNTITLKADGITAEYVTVGAGTSNDKVQYSNITLNNNTLGNYQLVDSNDAKVINGAMKGVGTINARKIAVVNVKALADKTYSETNSKPDTAVIGAPEITLVDAAGDNKTIFVVEKQGSDGKVLITTLDPVQGKYGVFDGTNFVENGNVNRTRNQDGTYTAAQNRDVQYTGVESFLGSNYELVTNTSDNTKPTVMKETVGGKMVYYVYGQGKITPAQRTVTVTKIEKEYDGNDVIKKDDLKFNGTESWLNNITVVSGSYSDKNVHLDGALSNLVLRYDDANETYHNYDVDMVNSVLPTTGTITARKLYAHLVEGTADLEKVYDGTPDLKNGVSISGWVQLIQGSQDIIEEIDHEIALEDRVGIDTDNITVKYADKNVNNAGQDYKKAIYFTTIGLKNNNNGNYTLVLHNAEGAETAEPLTTTGKITKKKVELNITPGNIEKYYDQYATITTGDDSNAKQFKDALEASVMNWVTETLTGDLAGDAVTFGLDTSGLTGVYGSWDPSNANNFITDPNVHREGNTATGTVKEKSHDVLYYGFKLNDASTQNYELANVTTYTVDGVSASDLGLGDTVYFKEAAQSGTIRPLAITLDRVKEKWTAPDTKVYDKNPSIASVMGSDGTYTYTAYDVNGQAITKTANDYLTIYFDKTNDGYSPDDIPITYTVDSAAYTYTVDSATYNDANAGDVKSITYSGFHFSNTELGNYTITDGSLNDSTKYGKGLTATVKGSIARRLLVVAADGTDHTKTYDGNEHSLLTYIKNGEGNYVENPLAYTVAAQDTQNDDGTGRVGNDKVSVTYVANFNPTGTWDAAKDVNIMDQTTGTYTYKNVTYAFTLSGDDAANYTIVADKRTVGDGGTTATDTQQGVSAIKPREVYVDFATDNADVYQGEGLDKIYDGDASLFTGTNNETSLLASGKSVNEILTLVSATNDTGIVGDENLTLDTGHVTANYVDADGHASADSDAKLGITTRKVYIQNLNLTGTGNANNYVVKAVKKQGDTQDTNTLEGKGSVAQRQVAVGLSNTAPVTKVYDKTESLKGFSATDITPVDITTIVPASGIVGTDNLGLSVESAIYYDYDQTTGKPQPQYGAKDGLGVSYRLKWSNTNYTLVKVPLTDSEVADKNFVKESGNLVGYGTLNTDGVGTITPRTLTYKDESSLSVDKTYDGTTDVKDASAVATGIFAYATVGSDTGLVAGDEKDLLTTIDTRSHYDSKNTGATAATGIQGTPQKVTLGFTVNDNYRLDANNNLYDQDMHPIIEATGTADANGYKSGTYTGPGRINRAEVTMTPTEVSYYPSQLANATYSGSASGFVNGDARPAMTFGRDGNTATAAGNYTLLGYVNGTRIGTGDTFVDGVENYYFRTTPNTYLHILAEPVNLDVPDIPGINGKPVTQAITETVISDKKFTPDEFSYARISKDQDPTHMVRESSAALQYSEKGVNLDGGDTKSGLAALADIQGAGSVVNLEGAFIRTSAPAEQPETVAAEAALPVPETEESDISSISLEYAGDGDNSQALLEILTNASSNAEKKGTSIVIDAQDEDEEDAEEEKSRRAIFADRSNIGIETLGNAVNLNQMIG